MPTIEFNKLEQIATSLLEAADVPTETARKVAQLLVLSERIGHSSHGVLRIPTYVQWIQEGKIKPHASSKIVRETPTTALIDGGWGFGQITAMEAMECAIDKARQSGTATVGAYHLNHTGRLGDFTEMAAAEGFVAFAFVGGTPTGRRGNVAPFGGARAVWGTNPLAIAIPTGEQPFSLDFATSIIAGGKAAVARSKEVELPEGYIIDGEGRPTRDPWAVLQGGAILPFGQHKGYGLAFVVELLAGALIGAAAPELSEEEMAGGLFFIVIDITCFRSEDAFQTSVNTVFQRVKSCLPAEGVEEVLIPGEPEWRKRSASDQTDILVPDSIYEALNGVAQRLGIELDW